MSMMTALYRSHRPPVSVIVRRAVGTHLHLEIWSGRARVEIVALLSTLTSQITRPSSISISIVIRSSVCVCGEYMLLPVVNSWTTQTSETLTDQQRGPGCPVDGATRRSRAIVQPASRGARTRWRGLRTASARVVAERLLWQRRPSFSR